MELKAPSHIQVGEPLDVEIRYSTTGEDAFYLYRDWRSGVRGQIEILAEGEGCKVALSPFQPDIFDTEALRFSFFPVSQGMAIVETMRLNGPLSNGGNGAVLIRKLPIRKRGVYSLRASLVQDRLTRTQLVQERCLSKQFQPCWEGMAESNRVTIVVEGPRTESLLAWRERVRHCHEGRCDDLDGALKFEQALDYFSLVRDSEAATLLREMLVKSMNIKDSVVAPASSIAPVVMAQGRPEDAPVLRAYARQVSSARVREYYEDAAVELERADPCR
jgi:hypothetical protein